MKTPRLHSFTLAPFPDSETVGVRAIGGQIARTHFGLQLTYRLDADLALLRIPEPQAAEFTDELWRHTCFELFVAREGEARYHEFNFSPSTQWAVYAFSRYREPAPLDAAVPLIALDPRLHLTRSGDGLELSAEVRLDRLSPHFAGARLLIGLSAVIEAREGDAPLSYWALEHPGAKPDFHHPDTFVLELDEIRN